MATRKPKLPPAWDEVNGFLGVGALVRGPAACSGGFVNNVYHGYQVVQREMHLDDSGNVPAGPVVSVRYLVNGHVFSDQCGIATSTRI